MCGLKMRAGNLRGKPRRGPVAQAGERPSSGAETRRRMIALPVLKRFGWRTLLHPRMGPRTGALRLIWATCPRGGSLQNPKSKVQNPKVNGTASSRPLGTKTPGPETQPVPLLKWVFILLTVLAQPGCDRWSATVSNEPTNSSPAPRKTQLVPLTNMVLVKAGTFVRLKHSVTLTHSFWLGKYEVTQGEYAALMGKNPSHFPGDLNRPVEKLSHVDATAYCSVLTRRERDAGRLPPGYEYRLPTEAEWEYACRAGTTNFFSFGDDEASADAYAWTEENSQSATHPVGQKHPNPWGFYDMHGNVWEWCQDWFGEYPAKDVTDPLGPSAGKLKVFRGGGWNHEAKFARCGNRFTMAPSMGIHFVGFRIALGESSQSPADRP